MVGRPAVTVRSSLESLRPLTPAEERIIADLAVGEFDRLGDGRRPESDDPIPARFARPSCDS